MGRITTLFMVLALLFSACAEEEPEGLNITRGGNGAADATRGFDPSLSCAGQCGDVSVNDGEEFGYCFCSGDCLEYEDCCDDFVPSCNAEACAATGGDWMADGEYELCMCTLEPGAPVRTWDDNLGCVSGPNEELCESSGGDWMDEECLCAQDGASAYMVYDNEVGCTYPEWYDIASWVDYEAELADFINPTVGFYLIDRPGAIDAVTHYDSLAAMLEAQSWYADVLASPVCPLREGTTEYSCEEEEGFSVEGCFVAESSATPVSDLYRAYEEYEFFEVTEEQWSDAAELESSIDYHVIITSQNLGLYFGEVLGEMRLLIIDVASYDCSA